MLHDTPDEAPPMLRRWRNVYILLAGVLLLLGLFLYWFTKHFE
jgi:hypothetical protein